MAADPAPPSSPAVDACLAVTRAEAEIRRRFDASLGSLHGLSFSDFVALLHLRRAGQGRLRRAELAELLGMSQSGVARLLIPLEKIGLVTRETNPNDARVAYVVLTAAGTEKADDGLETAARLGEEVFGALPADDVATLTALSRRLAPAPFPAR